MSDPSVSFVQRLAAIAAGGACGAVLRYVVGLGAQALGGPGFPWATLAVNLIGCLVIGMLWALVERAPWSPLLSAFVFIGLLGSFTTFSTFGLDGVNLVRDGAAWRAVLYLGGSVLGGLLLVLLGFRGMRWVLFVTS